MIDAYDPCHPDGADDPDDVPGTPTSISWLDDDSFDEDWNPDSRPHLEIAPAAQDSPRAASMPGGSLPCGACGQPAASWTYIVGTGEDGNLVVDGYLVCAAHLVAA